MDEPIKLPPIDIYNLPADVARVVQHFMRVAVLQATADSRAEVDRMRGVLTAIVDFVDGPAEEKRPDVFFLRMNAARNALKEPK
jgi:hypothetical protein